MRRASILIKKKLIGCLILFELVIFLLGTRIFFIQVGEANFWQKKAYEQQTRDRLIKANRGMILDRNMISLAETQSVNSISIIHAQIKEPEKIANILASKLDLDYDYVLKKIKKNTALERIKTKVDKNIADNIRELNLKGVIIDEDIKRIYPYCNLAAQVIGFVGKDNQGIIGLEAKYDKYLKGKPGKIMTETDASGRELKNGEEYRQEPIDGKNLVLSLDIVLQRYAEQALEKAIKAKNAKRGAIILLNPNDGEIYAMANKPDFDLNKPFEIKNLDLNEREKNIYLNKIWRNFSINDTYEPGSAFKIITSAAGLEEKIINIETKFNCSGVKLVGGRNIRCWKLGGHGSENFVQGVQNSCNPVFMEIAEKLGRDSFYKYINKFGLKNKTGVDLPGEAIGIMHALKNVGPVELATMGFGQSFQVTPLELMRAASCVINGGKLITPHFGREILDSHGNIIKKLRFIEKQEIISRETSETMKKILESVVSKGTGNKSYIPGYRIGGKTATSEKLPRKSGKYIASFLTFSPAEKPILMALVLIDEPEGIYYGGQVAGPIMKEVLENALPYLNVKRIYNQEEINLDEVKEIEVPDFLDLEINEAKKKLNEIGLDFEIIGEGKVIYRQFPLGGEKINFGSKVILYVKN